MDSHSYSKLRLDDEKLLSEEERDSREFCEYCRNRTYTTRSSKLKIVVVVLACQAAIALLALVGYLIWRHQHSYNGFDDFRKLETYNSTGVFGINNAADVSPEADEFWKNIFDTNGFVAIENKAAERMNLPPSLPHPDDPKSKIYQINTYHSFHCLYRIRSRLNSRKSLEAFPRNDPHTLHCLDHIRKSLLCHPDLSLHGTRDYVVYNNGPLPHTQQCRDLSAVQAWSRAHAWPGYQELWEKFDWERMERRIGEELKKRPGIRWDEYREFYGLELEEGFRLEFLGEREERVG